MGGLGCVTVFHFSHIQADKDAHFHSEDVHLVSPTLPQQT